MNGKSTSPSSVPHLPVPCLAAPGDATKLSMFTRSPTLIRDDSGADTEPMA